MKDTLIQIHNALITISVKGEDTITMAKCLMALRELVQSQEEGGKEENG